MQSSCPAVPSQYYIIEIEFFFSSIFKKREKQTNKQEHYCKTTLEYPGQHLLINSHKRAAQLRRCTVILGIRHSVGATQQGSLRCLLSTFRFASLKFCLVCSHCGGPPLPARVLAGSINAITVLIDHQNRKQIRSHSIHKINLEPCHVMSQSISGAPPPPESVPPLLRHRHRHPSALQQ